MPWRLGPIPSPPRLPCLAPAAPPQVLVKLTELKTVGSEAELAPVDSLLAEAYQVGGGPNSGGPVGRGVEPLLPFGWSPCSLLPW